MKLWNCWLKCVPNHLWAICSNKEFVDFPLWLVSKVIFRQISKWLLLFFPQLPNFGFYLWQYIWLFHSVWKSQKKSHSTALRAKRATFTFWVDKRWLKVPKMVHFGEFLKTWSLRSNSVTRQVNFIRTKIGGKCQNWKIQMGHFEEFLNNVSLSQ